MALTITAAIEPDYIGPAAPVDMSITITLAGETATYTDMEAQIYTAAQDGYPVTQPVAWSFEPMSNGTRALSLSAPALAAADGTDTNAFDWMAANDWESLSGAVVFCTVRGTDSEGEEVSLTATQVISTATILAALSGLSIDQCEIMQADANGALDDDGEYIYGQIQIGIADTARMSDITCTLYYVGYTPLDNVPADPFADLSAPELSSLSIAPAAAQAGIDGLLSSSVTLSDSYDWYFRLVVTDGYETVTADASWINGTIVPNPSAYGVILDEDFAPYDNDSFPRLEVYGAVVNLHGAVKSARTLTMDASASYTMFVVGTAYRPARERVYLCHSGVRGLWTMRVKPNGDATIENHMRVDTGAYVNITTDIWIPFSVTWVLEE